ncbi:carotenoid biosynthesis protein [Exiguobacterium sp. SL14]|nr:carotenoid biosynthesis protein [Exiguobacterium sp. SL14]MCY1691339.1 carotenoid biosynthesis protein [Exiguobacterium sp. SL14]
MRYSTLLLVPLFTVWLDLAIDPVAALNHYWIWQESGIYYDIPSQNFLGWYLTALFFSLFIAKYEKPATNLQLERNNQKLFLMLHVLFGVTAWTSNLHGILFVTCSAILMYLVYYPRYARRTSNQ